MNYLLSKWRNVEIKLLYWEIYAFVKIYFEMNISTILRMEITPVIRLEGGTLKTFVSETYSDFSNFLVVLAPVLKQCFYTTKDKNLCIKVFIAYMECYTNSVCHGVLGISSKELSENATSFTRNKYIVDKSAEFNYKGCYLESKVVVDVEHRQIGFTMTDSGKGFNTNATVVKTSFTGRGTDLIRHTDAIISYNDKGNSITCVWNY